MINSFNLKKILIAVFIPLVLLVIALAITDGISYWDEFEDVWIIWIIYLVIIFILEWNIIGKINVKTETERLQIFSKELVIKIKKIVKWFLIVTVIILILILVLIPIGYFYNNQKIPVDKFELFDSMIWGNWEKGIMSKYATRITNNSKWDAKDIFIRISIYSKDNDKILDEVELVFAEWHYLKKGFTNSVKKEDEYGIISGLPKNFDSDNYYWKSKITSVKKVTFIDKWF